MATAMSIANKSDKECKNKEKQHIPKTTSCKYNNDVQTLDQPTRPNSTHD